MSKLTAPLVLALSILSGNANADFLGLYIGGGAWDHDPAGTFGSVGVPAIDVETDLSYKGEKDTYAYVAFEHFVPLVPNVRIERASMGHTGTAAGTFNFAGNPGATGPSSISLDTQDKIIYWRLLDNWVNADFGFNFRRVDADFIIGAENVSVSKSVPMLYLAAQLDLPFTGFSVGADINKISVSTISYQEMRVRAIYEIGVVGFEAGIRSTSIEMEDLGGINADIEFKGVMFGAFLHF